MNKIGLTLVLMVVFIIGVMLTSTELYRPSMFKSISWNKAVTLTDDNIIIDIEYAKPLSPRQIVIMVHSTVYESNKKIWHELGIARRLLNYDSAVVLFDLRFHGNSTPALASGPVALPQESMKDYGEDLESVIKWAKKNLGSLPIIVVCYSDSSKIVLEHALKDNSIKGIVLILAKYADIVDLIEKYHKPILVLSDDNSWRNIGSVLYVGIYRDYQGKPLWDESDLDILFNWIKNIGLAS